MVGSTPEDDAEGAIRHRGGTDLHALGRLAETRGGARPRGRLVVRAVGGAPAATRSPRVPRWALVAALAALAALAYLGAVAARQTDADAVLAQLPAAPTRSPADLDEGPGTARGSVSARADRSARTAAAPAAGAAPAAAPGAAPAGGQPGTALFAEVDGLGLALPHSETVAVAFHEAARPEALELTPVGRLVANDNPTRYAPPQDSDGPAYRVLSSRGRPRPATSAADLVVPGGASALAPVSGTVVEVRQYVLYGSLRDWRVAIAPHGRPDLHVVLIHLHRPALVAGDEVEAGRTPVGVVRQLPFPSHVDYVTEQPSPHLHLEVKPATAPQPHDPNEPAMDARERLEEVTGAVPSGS